MQQALSKVLKTAACASLSLYCIFSDCQRVSFCDAFSFPRQHSIDSRFVKPRVPFRHKIKASRVVTHLSASNISASTDDALVKPTTTTSLPEIEVNNDDAFSLLSSLAAVTLLKSDARRDAIGKGSGAQGSSAANFIDEQSAFTLQSTINRLALKLADERRGVDRDEASTWIRWMKSAPTPLIIDLSVDFKRLANATLSDEYLDLVNIPRSEFLNRMGCRLLLMPSGAELKSALAEPTGTVIFGKLLYGGVTRYRILPSSTSSRPTRRTGEKTEIKASVQENVPSWIQYGGPNRMYEAVDMGAAAVLELLLLPQTKELASVFEKKNGDMALSRMVWSPQKMFSFLSDSKGASATNGHNVEDDEILLGNTPMTLAGKDRNDAFTSDFRSTVGGLETQIKAIVRRVLDGRIIRPADEEDDFDQKQGFGDTTTAELSLAAMEAEELALLGLSPVRGLLLYGPPGCGKTALAREISRALRARSPKIVSAPELLDRWVGGSEKLVRGLFADAEAELAACNGDATRSALHVIVIDEIDAVFRKRSTADDSGEATRSSAVNQILAKLDGVSAIPNVLLIGMTNRRELLDEALLRPGRLEVQVEIPLPNQAGRREIMQIHFDALRRKGRLSKPLCCAIDGVAGYEDEVKVREKTSDDWPGKEEPMVADSTPTVRGKKRRAIKRVMNQMLDSIPSVGWPVYDLAAESVTGGFSGADIAGLVRCAGSIALARARNDGNGVDGLLITLEDVKQALVEVKQ